MDTTVYFVDDDEFGLQAGAHSLVSLIQCQRCACIVLNQEASKEQHISWHRGWWVGHHEETAAVIDQDMPPPSCPSCGHDVHEGLLCSIWTCRCKGVSP